MAVKLGDVEFDRRHMIGWGVHGTVVLYGTFKGDQPVAVKRFITRHLDQNTKDFAIYRRLRHDNIIRLLDIASDKTGFTYFALELCICNLADYLSGKYRGPPVSRHAVLSQTCQGLQHLHSLSIVHRAIKPSNVLFSEPLDGQEVITIKLSDFGFGSRSNDSWPCGNVDNEEGWLAPEQNKSTAVTTAVDIFSLGCLFFSVLTSGQHPFGSPAYFRDQRAQAGHYDLAPIDQQLPIAGHLIERMIQPEPHARPPLDDIMAQSKFWAMDF